MGLLAVTGSVFAVFVLGGVGDAFRSKISLKDRRIMLQLLGIVVFVLGGWGVLSTMVDPVINRTEIEGSLLPAVMLVIGGGVGYALRIDQSLMKLGSVFVFFFDQNKKKKKLDTSLSADGFEGLLVKGREQFGYGFVLATVLVSSGPFFMDAMSGDGMGIFLKILVDAVAVFILGMVYGGGASMAALSVVAVQGVLSAVFFLSGAEHITPKFTDQMAVMASLIMLLTGAMMVTGKRWRVANLLLGYVLAVVYQLAVVSVMPSV